MFFLQLERNVGERFCFMFAVVFSIGTENKKKKKEKNRRSGSARDGWMCVEESCEM